MRLLKQKYPPQAKPALPVFPTRHRDKHGKAVSFPLGAEILSRALDGVPQHGLIGVHFYVGNIERRPLRPREHVLHVTYNGQASLHDNNQERIWSITVFAIPCTFRNQMRALLVGDALPNVLRPWLMDNSAIAGSSGSSALTIEFDTDTGLLITNSIDKLQPGLVYGTRPQ